MRADIYGVRAVIEMDGVPIKIEFLSENRIELSGSIHHAFGVPTLSRVDMYAEKLLANADRWADRSVMCQRRLKSDPFGGQIAEIKLTPLGSFTVSG